MFSGRLSFIPIPAYARLSKIVDSRPHEISYHILMVVNGCPTMKCLSWIAFRLPHDPIWYTMMIIGMFVNQIVIANHI